MSTIKKNISVRFDDQTRKDLARLAELSGMGEAGLIRLCVMHGLPVVEETFGEMRAKFKTLANQAKAKEGRYPELDSEAALMNEPKKWKAS